MNEFNHLITRLEEHLSKPLPGLEAQKRMSPEGRRNLRNGNLPEKKAGVLILLYPEESRICFPLMRRPEYGGVHSGQISLPGGKKEDNDRNLVETALRETEEELGISAIDVQVLGSLSELYIQPSNVDVLPVVGYVKKVPNFVPDSFEVMELIEADLSLLLSENTIKQKMIKVNNSTNIASPYYDIGGNVVWGATAMILSEFVTVLQEIGDVTT